MIHLQIWIDHNLFSVCENGSRVTLAPGTSRSLTSYLPYVNCADCLKFERGRKTVEAFKNYIAPALNR